MSGAVVLRKPYRKATLAQAIRAALGEATSAGGVAS
jgi:hypothetical protein